MERHNEKLISALLGKLNRPEQNTCTRLDNSLNIDNHEAKEIINRIENYDKINYFTYLVCNFMNDYFFENSFLTVYSNSIKTFKFIKIKKNHTQHFI